MVNIPVSSKNVHAKLPDARRSNIFQSIYFWDGRPIPDGFFDRMQDFFESAIEHSTVEYSTESINLDEGKIE